jgi:putative nucleotidyltransferase with HDIG domain
MTLNHQDVLQVLVSAGHESYFVGGCVRDQILGRRCKDYDVTTSATPEEITALFPMARQAGTHFGILSIDAVDGEVQIATFRSASAYGPERPAWGHYTKDVREDLARRDFTMNTLLRDVDGKVTDLFGGVGSLRSYRIETNGPAHERFREDPLRMLRSVRFAVELGFYDSHEVFLTTLDMAESITTVATERIAIELSRILTSGRAGLGIKMLQNRGLLVHILPEISAMVGVSQNPKYHPEGDVWIHTMGLLHQLPQGCSLTLALAALLHDVGKPRTANLKDGQNTFHAHAAVGANMAKRILRRLKFSNEVIDTVADHVDNHMKFMDLSKMRQAKQLMFVRRPNFGELIALHRLDTMAGKQDLTHYNYANDLLTATPPEVLRPGKLITGQGLKDMGLPPGPQFKTILDAVEVEQLEGRVKTREEAVQFVMGMTLKVGKGVEDIDNA